MSDKWKLSPFTVGRSARACEVLAERDENWRPDWDASIGLFLVNGPFHPFWAWWAIAVVHLRDLPGVPPSFKQYEAAEYEFGIHSLDAGGVHGKPFDPAKDRWASRILQPPDVVQHFDVGATLPVEERDRVARKVLELAIAAVVDAYVSPDSDFRSWWKSAIPRTVEHVLTGGQHSKGLQA